MTVYYDANAMSHHMTGIEAGLGATLISVYQGTIPTNAHGFNPSTHSANLLVTFTSATSTSITSITGGGKIKWGPAVTTATAVATGTATWFAVYNSSVNAKAIIAEPSLTNEDGMLQLDTLSIVDTTTITMYELNISFYWPV